jgi:CheY-like chemotaxis protein
MSKLILIVDDNDSDRTSLAVLLRNAGFGVYTVKDGGEAYERIPQLKPALILLDMLMPAFDGWSFLDCRRTTPDVAAIPVLIVTGLEVASVAWALALGAAGLIRKPINPDDLIARVQELLGVPADELEKRLASEKGLGTGD